MTDDFSVVDRHTVAAQQRRSGNRRSALGSAVIETVGTGQAVQYELNGRKPRSLYNSMMQLGMRQTPQLKFHWRLSEDKAVAFMWMEPL